MNQTPRRREAKTNFVALLAAVLAVLAFAIVPVARASTGGAAPGGVETEPTTEEAGTTTAFNEAELSFTPYRFAGASWYGGKTMWGRSTACGQVLRPATVGVANKTLPCGTPVKFVWHGHSLVAPVIDRGPYIKGRAWDLTSAAAEALEFEGIGRIQYAVAIEYARKGL
ncbi:MAG TPA: septal ring lytic transglycosylase RlpA family protein [Solirubrobacterales bacterium]|jgi:rare lipoprotein A (peptidoglycan hydrolase)